MTETTKRKRILSDIDSDSEQGDFDIESLKRHRSTVLDQIVPPDSNNCIHSKLHREHGNIPSETWAMIEDLLKCSVSTGHGVWSLLANPSGPGIDNRSLLTLSRRVSSCHQRYGTIGLSELTNPRLLVMVMARTSFVSLLHRNLLTHSLNYFGAISQVWCPVQRSSPLCFTLQCLRLPN